MVIVGHSMGGLLMKMMVADAGDRLWRAISDRPFSEATAEAIDAEVSRITADSHEEARHLLSAHRSELDALAHALLARESLNEREILEVTGLPPAPALGNGMLPVPGGSARLDPS